MKKLFSLVTMALVALAATTFVSCSNSDDEGTFTFSCNIDCQVSSDALTKTIINGYQAFVGSDATVSNVTNGAFTITGSASKKDAVWSKIKSAEMSTLHAAIDNLNIVCYAAVRVCKEDDTLWYEYYMDYGKFLPGTYTATAQGKAIKFVISTASTAPLPATVTFGDKTYTGSVSVTSGTDQIMKFTDAAGSDFYIQTNGDLYTLAFADALDKFAAFVEYEDGSHDTSIEFTRQ